MPTLRANTSILSPWLISSLYYARGLLRCSTDAYVWGLIRTALKTSTSQATIHSCLTRIRDRLHFSMRNTGYFYRSWLALHQTPPTNRVDVNVLVFLTKAKQARVFIDNLIMQVEHSQSICILVDGDSANLAHLLSDKNVRVLDKSKLPGLDWSTQKYMYVTHDDFHTHSGSILQLVECAERNTADFTYGDEDQWVAGQRCKPLLKPNFDPILLESYDYIGPNFLVRLDLVNKYPKLLISRFPLKNSGYIKVAHCPSPIVSRVVPSPQITNAIPSKSKSDRRFSFIIPTKDQPSLLTRLTKQLLDLGDESRVQLIVLNNSDANSETDKRLTELQNLHTRLSVINLQAPFNWSRFNNKAASECDSEILVFLNDDMTLLDHNLLERLNSNFDNPQVGIVGALLTFPSGEIQHAGIVMGMGGFADHIYRDCPINEQVTHPFVSPSLRRTVSAVTGAFFAIRRDLFECLEGFNEDLRHTGDVELCIRATNKGFRTVFDPAIKFIHHESQTRGSENLDDVEKKNLSNLVPLNQRDAYFNPNLSLRSRYPTLRL